MSRESIDIIVPVWNRPVETRACLASLIEYSPASRLILVDNSSDRETEQMLGEFAEALDVRALFLKNRQHEGFVKAVNRGLASAETDFVAIVRQNSVVRPGWLEPLHAFMLNTADAGIAVPAFTPSGAARSLLRGMEVVSGDFAAMLLRRSMLQAVGCFDEEMDGGRWCLLDFSRRGWRAGYKTCVVPDAVVERSAEVHLGSAARRQEMEQAMRSRFRDAWGMDSTYCLHLTKGSDADLLEPRLAQVAAAARQGHRVTLLAHPSVKSPLIRAGYDRCHEQVFIQSVARLLPERSARKAVDRLDSAGMSLIHVDWGHGFWFPCGDAQSSFEQFAETILANELRYYRSGSTLPPAGRIDENGN